MNNTELPIAPLSVYEADPAFPQDEEGRRSFYDEYFSVRRDNVKSSTDVESWLNDRYEFEHREMAKAAAVTYAGRDPEEVKNLFSKSEEELKAAGENDAIDYIKWNDEVSKKKIEADNINKGSAILAKYGEDKIVKVKPFKFNEKDMLEVTLPDGTVDLIDGEIQPDFADSLIKHHSNKFTPEEKLKFYDAWNQTVHGTKAAINETKKGFYGIYSGLALDKAKKLNDFESAVSNAYGPTPNMEDPNVAALVNLPAYDSIIQGDLDPESVKLDAAGKRMDAISRINQLATDAGVVDTHNLQNYTKDELINKVLTEIREKKTKAISALLDSFKQAGAIKGSQALDKFNRDLMSNRNGRDNATGFTEYFDKNPDELMPWISATVASSLPDVGIGVGAGLVGSAAGGPLGGAAAAGSWGVKREYTASVLESLQSEAAKRGMPLNNPENINTLLDDKELMDAADKKAKIRAGIIGATDAISGGLVGNITKPLKNVVGKIVTNQFIEAGTEYSGEIFAQYATEGKVKFSEGVAEALGGIAAGPVAAVSEISDHKAKAKENVAAAVDSAKATVFEAVPGAAPKPKPTKGSAVVDVDFTENNPAPTPTGDINTSTEPKVTTTFHPQQQIEYSEDAPKQKQLTFPTEEEKASEVSTNKNQPFLDAKEAARDEASKAAKDAVDNLFSMLGAGIEGKFSREALYAGSDTEARTKFRGLINKIREDLGIPSEEDIAKQATELAKTDPRYNDEYDRVFKSFSDMVEKEGMDSLSDFTDQNDASIKDVAEQVASSNLFNQSPQIQSLLAFESGMLRLSMGLEAVVEGNLSFDKAYSDLNNRLEPIFKFGTEDQIKVANKISDKFAELYAPEEFNAPIREVETPEQRSVREEDINLPSGIEVAPQPIIHPSIPSPFVDPNGNTGVEMTLPITNNPQEEGVHFIDAVHGTNVPELTSLDPAFSGDTNRLGTAVYLYPAENEQDSVDFAKGKAILEGGTPTLYKTRIHAAPENTVDLNKPIYLQDPKVWRGIYNALGAQRTPGTSDSQPLNFFFSTLQPEEVAKLAQNGIKLGIFKQEDGPTTYAVYDGSAIEIKDSRTLDTVFGNPTPVTPEPAQPLPSDYITTVYHGTYATIEASTKPYLSVDFINTGEKTQNEGWGIYLTDKQAIGEWYKSSVSQMYGRPDTEFYLDGELYFRDPIDLGQDDISVKIMDRIDVNSRIWINGVMFEESGNGEIIEASIIELIQEQLAYIKLTGSEKRKEEATRIIRELKSFDSSRIQVKHQKLGNAYKVNLKYNEGEMLELEKPYDEQSDKVKAAFASYPPLMRAYNDNPNDSVYTLMIEVWNYSGTGLTQEEVKKELSMNYLKNGVKLSRYYTGETRHSSGEKEYNYVVFDDGVIEMVANIEDESKSWPERILDVLQSSYGNPTGVPNVSPEQRSVKLKKIFEDYQVNDPLLADLLTHDYIREALENIGSTVEEVVASLVDTDQDNNVNLPFIRFAGVNPGIQSSINKNTNAIKGLVREFIRASNNRTAAKGIIFQEAVNEALSSGDLIDIYNYKDDVETDVDWAYNLRLPGPKEKVKTNSIKVFTDDSLPAVNDIIVDSSFNVYGVVLDDGTIHVFNNLQTNRTGSNLTPGTDFQGARNFGLLHGLKTEAPVGSLIHAIVIYQDKENPQLKSVKALTSGTLGSLFKAIHPSIAIGEMISSLTGAPSPLDAAYEIMKAHLIGNPGTLEEMTRQAISGMPVAYADEDINTQAQVREGVKLYNPFIRFSRWAKAMTAKFAWITKKILADIYNAVRSVYNKANGVTKAFSNRYGINLTPDKSSLTAHSYMQAIAAIDAADGRDQSTPNLKGLLEYIIDHPASSLNEKRLARYILKSQGSDQLSKVPIYYATKKDRTSYFNPADVSVVFTNRADAYVILHEAMHAVTYNFIQSNMNLMAVYDKGQTLTPKQKREWLRAAATGDIDKKFTGTKFVDNEFRIIAGAYMDAYDAMKLPLDSPYGDISEDGYSYYKKYKGIHHYGIVNLHEFATEAYTNRSFGYTIGQIPSTNPTKVSSTVLKRTVNFMLRVLGVPIWNAGVLAETTGVIHDVLKNNRYDIDDPKAFKYFTKYHNTWINTNLLADSTVKALAYANEPSTPETRREEIINSAVSEQNDAEFGLIKKEFPEAFEANPSFVYDGTNLPEARRLAIDWLDEKIKEEEDSGGQFLDSSFNRDQEIMRLMQSARAASGFFRPENVVNIPTETVKVLRSAYQHLSDSVIDVDMMTNRQISRLIQIFSSLRDGQVPVGMKSAVNQWFTDTQINKLLGISSRAAARVAGSQGKKLLPPSVRPPQQKPSVSFRDPIANWRRRPIFGLFDAMQGVEFGSMATQAAEIAKIAPVEEAYEFITDIFSHLKGNVETQEIESRAVIDEFDQTIKRAIPKGMTYTQAHKIGWVANLTQYKDGNPKALEEMTNRLMLAGRGINTRKAQHGNDDVTVISEIALIEVTKGLRTGSVPEIINSLEANLTPGERKVLDKVREVGQRYRNALGAVSAITAGRPLEDIVNYSHHKVIHRNEEHTQSFGMAGFRSLEPVMQLRRGFNPEESWFDSDIISIFDDMVNQATYEAHTGIQRMMIQSLLNDRRFAMAVDENYLNPVRTDRLKVLLGNWHAAKVNSGNAMNSFMAFASNAIGIPTGALIIGFNSFLKNFSSAIPGRVFAVMQTHGSINPFTYETNRSLINKFIKDRVPGVDARLSRYENPIKEGRMSSTKERFKLKREGGKSILQAAATSGYRLVPDAVRIIKKVVDAGAHLSNAIPDAFHAKSVWIQAYLYKLIQDKKISHANDWIAAPFFDSAASTYATSVTDNAFGYAGRREDKGEFWYGNSVAKQVMARALLFFSQQAKGIAIEAQTNLALSISLARHPAMGASAEKHAAKAVTQILNSTIFRSLTAILSTTAVIGGLSHFLDGYGDDEEKKRAIEEAERQRADAIRRINKKDALYELITTVIPVTTANPILEPITERFLDDAGVVVDRQIIMDKSLPTEEISLIHKQQVDEEIKAVDKEVKRIKDIANGPLSFGMSDADKNRLEKLDQYRKELSEVKKFKYFPNDPVKAAFHMLGGFGIAGENAFGVMDRLFEGDLDSDEKKQLKELQKEIENENDPWSAKAMTLELLARLKIGSNPKTTVERAKRELAQKRIKEMKEKEAEINKLRKSLGL